MSEDTVSKDFLFFVTDFIVDELSQSAASANEIKRRVRSIATNLSRFISPGNTDAEDKALAADIIDGALKQKTAVVKPSNGETNGSKQNSKSGKKRKDVPVEQNTEEIPPKKTKKGGDGGTGLPATSKKAKAAPTRARTSYSLFITYGFNYIKEHMPDIHLPATKVLPLLQQYRKYLTPGQLGEFEDNTHSVLESAKDNPSITKTELISQLKALDEKLGHEPGNHPTFHEFQVFFDRVGKQWLNSSVPESPTAAAAPSSPVAITPVPVKSKKKESNGTVTKTEKASKAEKTAATKVSTAKKPTKIQQQPKKVVQPPTEAESDDEDDDDDEDDEEGETDEESGEESSGDV